MLATLVLLSKISGQNEAKLLDRKIKFWKNFTPLILYTSSLVYL